MTSEIKFLKELQEELNTQDNDGQAAPRFWVVMDYKTVATSDGLNDRYEVYNGETSEAHSYAMTAWRAPKVERLLNILSSTPWDYVLELESNKHI